ncbi:MAG: radical SAM protein [Nitrospirae bacterium]|nr:radical SAM protein [Nitrospirota bacterium]
MPYELIVAEHMRFFDSLLYWNAPRVAFFEVTNHCNLRCVMCAHTQEGLRMEKGHMEWPLFEDVFRQCGDIKSVCLFSAGEPLLARNWDSIVGYCVENLPDGVDITFSTNGLLFTKEKILPLLGKNVSITISVDGATQNTYESIRQGGSFEKLLRNIRLINTLKDRYQTDKPSIEFAFAAWQDNVTELPLIAKLAVDMRAKQLVVAQRIFFNKEDFKQKSLLFAKERFDHYLQKAVSICHSHDISIIHGGSYSGAIPPPEGLINRFFDMTPDGRFACRTAEENVSIGFKGLIRACCFIDHLFMGNLRHNTLMEVWHGHNYRSLRLNLRSGNLPDGCKNCPFFQVLDKHEQSCLRTLNTDSYISASPEIKQPYNVFTLNSEFQRHMHNWQHGVISGSEAIRRLQLLWEKDNYLFEIANNIGVIFARNNDVVSARKWVEKACTINPIDNLLKENYDVLNST